MTNNLRSLSTIQPDQFVKFCCKAAKAGRDWEKTSMGRLFEHVSSAYDIAVYMTGAKKAEVSRFYDILSEHGVKVQDNSRIETLAARLVFGTDRKRCYVYGKAIARAKGEGIPAAEFKKWLSDLGGVEEAAKPAKGASHPVAADVLIELATGSLRDRATLAEVDAFSASEVHFAASDFGIAIIRKTASGAIAVVDFCSDDKVINSVLASHGRAIQRKADGNSTEGMARVGRAAVNASFNPKSADQSGQVVVRS